MCFFHMYIAPGRGRQPIGDKNFITTERPDSDFIHILNDFIHVYSSRAGTDNPLGTKFWCQQKFLITLPIYCQFKKKSLWSLIFYRFMCFFHMYIAPGRGRQCNGDKNSMTTERPFLFAHILQVSKWSLWNLILYTFLMILYMYIAPGQGQKTPWGQTFDVNRKPLSLRPFVASFKPISLNSDFIHIF